MRREIEDLKHRVQGLEESREIIQESCKVMQKSINKLTPLAGKADKIRLRFFETFKRDIGYDYNHTIVKDGNMIAHHGDICADILLTDEYDGVDTIFPEVYGLDAAVYKAKYANYSTLNPTFNLHGTLAAAVITPSKQFDDSFTAFLNEVDSILENGIFQREMSQWDSTVSEKRATFEQICRSEMRAADAAGRA